ncbi:MAG TPA: ABC transporter permease [Thermoanaerobaculia bacterium]|nr:ABC transporter permease [Thermoanaerobaculia bacterium]
MTSWLLDLRVALRVLRSKPGFSVIAILALALGIGANVAIYSVVDGIYLHRLPYRDPGSVVVLWEDQTAQGGTRRSPVDPGTLLDWQRRAVTEAAEPAFADIAALRNESRQLTGLERPVVPLTHVVTDNYFEVLGVAAQRGRTFRPGDGEAGGLVLLSHGLWQSVFGGDPELVGSRLELSGEAHTVIGILPATFYSHHLFPTQPDLWVPSDFRDEATIRDARALVAFGRLAPEATLTDARAVMETIASDLAGEHPETNAGWSVLVEPVQESVVGGLRRIFTLLLAAVGAVLLVSCVNVANLMLARAAQRRREVALRTALGSSGFRVSRLLLTEGLLLAMLGGALGVMLASTLIRPIASLIPQGANVPFVEHVTVDGSVLLFALLVSIATSLAFGVAPARQALRVDTITALKEGSRAAGTSRGALRRGEILIVAEVALAMILVIAAGLVVQSLVGLHTTDPGFEPEGLFTWRTSVREPGSAGLDSAAAYVEEAERRVAALPGIDGVGSISFLPPLNPQFVQGFAVPSAVAEPGERPRTILRAITAGYLGTMRIDVLAGRGFDSRDRAGSAPVVIVNETLRRRYFDGVDPVGRTLSLDIDARPGMAAPPRTIVGVVADVITTGSQPEPAPAAYVPLPQSQLRVMNVVMRTRLDPVELADDTERAIWSVGGDNNVYGFQTLEQAIADTRWQTSFSAFLLGCFAGLALLLGVAGIYAVVSHSVGSRTPEIGLRIALGARAADVLAMVLGAGLRPVVLGILLGMAGAAATSRLLGNLLYGVEPVDAATFAAVGALLLSAALAAVWGPARRATRVDPMQALRTE